jgi:hypothetical protein
MADPQAASLNQLRNIEAKTGKTIAQFHAALADSGLAKTGERRAWLIEHFGLGYGDANAVALFFGKPLPELGGVAPPTSAAPAAPAGDPLDEIYAGAKAPLRALHERIMQVIHGFGSFEVAPKKGYVSLRRNKQFAMLGPATKDQIELGLNAKGVAQAERLKAQAPGGMCQYKVRLASVQEVDAELTGWLRAAFDAAG